MVASNLFATLAGCVFFMAIVAWVSYQKSKGEVDTSDGYFLAGRGLTGVFIAGSVLLSNLSAKQLVGVNGSAYGFNLSSMAWDVTAVFATICMALIFLPSLLHASYSEGLLITIVAKIRHRSGPFSSLTTRQYSDHAHRL